MRVGLILTIDKAFLDWYVERNGQTEQSYEGADNNMGHNRIAPIGVNSQDDAEVDDGSPQDVHCIYVKLNRAPELLLFFAHQQSTNIIFNWITLILLAINSMIRVLWFRA
jgi:hypothetical protein